MRRQPGLPDVTRIRYLGAVQEPENVSGVSSRPWAVRTGGGFEPAAQVVTVHSPGHSHVLAVLAAIGPLDNDHDQIRKLGPDRLIVVSDRHVSDEALLRTPRLGMPCPLLWVPRLPLQEEQHIGKTRPRSDVRSDRPVPQHAGQRMPPDLLIVPVRRVPPQRKPPPLRIAEPIPSLLSAPLGVSQTGERRSTFSRIARYQPVRPPQPLAPRIGTIDVPPGICFPRHLADHALPQSEACLHLSP